MSAEALQIENVVRTLREAQEGTRALDVQISAVLGWRRFEEIRVDPHTGERRPKTLWLIPNSDTPGRIPNYTTNLQAAYDLLNQVIPATLGADGVSCSWEDGSASAKVGSNYPVVQASTPMLALCIAALLIHLKTQS